MPRVLDEEFRLFHDLVDRYCVGLEELSKYQPSTKSSFKKDLTPPKTIDLHGKTTTEARGIFDELVGLRSSMKEPFLRFIIITGKGTETPSILKNTVERYFMSIKNTELKKIKDALGESGSYELVIYPL